MATEIVYNMYVRFTAVVPAFSAEGRRKNRISVDGDQVSVYDDVAGCYTTCHSLTKAQQQRLVRRAKQLCRDEGRCALCYGHEMSCPCDPT
jgi:hypothetical protein